MMTLNRNEPVYESVSASTSPGNKKHNKINDLINRGSNKQISCYFMSMTHKPVPLYRSQFYSTGIGQRIKQNRKQGHNSKAAHVVISSNYALFHLNCGYGRKCFGIETLFSEMTLPQTEFLPHGFDSVFIIEVMPFPARIIEWDIYFIR